MKTEILAASDELMTAVLNGVYQGIILTILVYLVLRFIVRTNAATRYCAWGATLLLVIAIIPGHYLRLRLFPEVAARTGNTQQDKSASDPGSAALIEPPAPDRPNANDAAIAYHSRSSGQDNNALSDSGSGPDGGISGLSSIETEAETRDRLEIGSDGTEFPTVTADLNPPAEPPTESLTARDPNRRRGVWGLERMLNPVAWNVDWFTAVPRMASAVLLLAWLSIAVFRAGLLLGRLYQIRRIKRTALPAGPELIGLFGRLRADLVVRRRVELKVYPVHASPVALGFLHPVILLPEEHACAPAAAETEQILRHELAHVRRHDDWANLAQNFIQAGLFFHPAVWWISKRLSLEREIACDDHVLQRGAERRAYALLLADLAGRLKRQDLVLAQGVSSSKSQLQQRINMILNTRRNTSPSLAKARLGFVTSAAALLALLALYAAPRLVLAQPPTLTAPVAPSPLVAGNPIIGVAPATSPVAIIASADEPDSAPTPPATPDVGPGPKFKPEKPGADALPPAPAVSPSDAIAGALPTPAPLAVIAGDVRPVGLPRPPGAPRALSADGSLEERIERLEQMVQSLMAQQNPKRHDAFVLRGGSGAEAFIDQKELGKMNEKVNEMARKQAERAAEQSKRAAEMADRANKNFDFKWKAEAENRDKGMRQEGFEKQLEALRRAKEGLERQMENLDRQIERVERDQERMQEERQRRSDLSDEEPKEETPSVAEAEEQ